MPRSDRRQIIKVLSACGVSALCRSKGWAGELPLKNTGLEHFGYTVPDTKAAAEFYGKIFDPQLFQERDPPPRYYVRLGIGYIAFGGNNKDAPAFIDHFCTLVDGYGQGETRKLFEAAGVQMGAGALGMAMDPDGLRLQTLGVPGGLARTIIPSARISQEPPLFQAIGPDYLILRVSNLEKSTEHYRKIYGKEAARTAKPTCVWFNLPGNTRLGLEPVNEGEKASIHHIGVKIAGFDRKTAIEKLKRAQVEVVRAEDKNIVRFKDLNGMVMDLKAGV